MKMRTFLLALFTGAALLLPLAGCSGPHGGPGGGSGGGSNDTAPAD